MGNTDDCSEKYRCTSEIYLMSVMLQCYSVIIDWGISAPGHGKEVVDGINAVDKRYIYQWMSNVQLPGSNRFDSHIQMHTSNQNNDACLAKEFQQHLTKEHSQKWCHWSEQIKKRLIERKWTDRQYHVQDNDDVAQKDLKFYCNTN